MVARTVLETLRIVTDSLEDVDSVFQVMNNLADDSEPSVRAELMEQIPHIAMYCQEYKSKLCHVIPENLLPMVVKFLTDSNNQVRKTSQAALLVLLEQGLVDKLDVEEQVCPVIIRLTDADTDSNADYRTEAVALLSKMAPLIGKEMSEKIFLERFASLCSDSLLHVRKVCAANFGDFSSVVGIESTEKVLLPKFFYLCEDGVWGVRKACADVFMPVSCVCSPNVRQKELSPIFINLLRDNSRWVRMAAFQALGPFISTFADPSITALLHNSNGEIIITDAQRLATRLEELEIERAKENPPSSRPPPPLPQETIKQCIPMDVTTENITKSRFIVRQTDKSPEELRADSLKESHEFNSFNYWRDPVPILDEISFDEDKDDDNDDPTTVFNQQEEDENDELNKLVAEDDDYDTSKVEDSTESNTMELLRPGEGSSNISTFDPRYDTYRSTDNEENNTGENLSSMELNPPDPCLPRGPPQTIQTIVPQLLIDHFVSMIDPSRAQTVDSEIARHCAFSLPAVALTLGRSNWPLLKETYNSLATDMQWKVRHTLASSIHELGIILGEDTAGNDLIPIFNDFIKDLDEVRIGILRHLADFIKLFKPELRRDYLPLLNKFLSTDNDRNWRFRQELTIQVGLMVDLFSVQDVKDTLVPIAFQLLKDKVSSVRSSAITVFCTIIRKLSATEENNELCKELLSYLGVNLATKSNHWVQRQTYALLCLNLTADQSVDINQFGEYMLPHLLTLASDNVPNVRIAVARVLSELIEIEYIMGDQNTHLDKFLEAFKLLESDSDADVRYLANKTAYEDSTTQRSINSDEEESLTNLDKEPLTTSVPLNSFSSSTETPTLQADVTSLPV